MRNVTVIVNWSPLTCYSKLFIWRTLLIVGTARADTLNSSSSEEQGSRGKGRGEGRQSRAGGSQRSTLDEACFVVGPAFVPCAVWLVLQHQAAANGFSSHSSRPAAGCVWLWVCVCISARMCVCVENYAKNFLWHTWNFSCKFEIEIRREKSFFVSGKLWMKRRRETSGVWSGVCSLHFPLYFPCLCSIFIFVSALFSVCCSVLLSLLWRISDFCFLFFLFWHLQKASNLWRLYVSGGRATPTACAWFIIYAVAQQRGRRTGAHSKSSIRRVNTSMRLTWIIHFIFASLLSVSPPTPLLLHMPTSLMLPLEMHTPLSLIPLLFYFISSLSHVTVW